MDDIRQRRVQSKPTENSGSSKIRSNAVPPSHSSVLARRPFSLAIRIFHVNAVPLDRSFLPITYDQLQCIHGRPNGGRQKGSIVAT